METKTSKAVEAFKAGDIKGALRIFKTFKIGFSVAERRTIQIAYESMTGNESFYQSLQIDTTAAITAAINLITVKYITNK